MAETFTINYNWTKPEVGASIDNWGGFINADLDSIDSTVKSVSTVANAAYPATNPAGYQTAANVTAAMPVASSTTPIVNGTAAVGTGTTWARADHVHPTDTSGWLGDNRIVNGDMRIDQRNNGVSGTATGYTVDRWQWGYSIAGKMTWGRNLNAVTGPAGFPYYLGFQSASAYTPLATDYFQITQAIEADMVSDFAWGTANALPVTLSFWARSSLTGTFGGCVLNYAGTRSYPFSYSLPAANTWTKIALTIPADTSGTWVMSGNAASMLAIFDLGTGSTWRGPANAWVSANYNGATGAVNVVATNAATFYLTGVKLEVGSVATPFNRQSLAKSMADCQRYFQSPWILSNGYQSSGVQVQAQQQFVVTMRAAPTLVITTNSNANINAFTLTSNVNAAWSGGTAASSGQTAVNCNYTASAEL